MSLHEVSWLASGPRKAEKQLKHLQVRRVGVVQAQQVEVRTEGSVPHTPLCVMMGFGSFYSSAYETGHPAMMEMPSVLAR